MNPDPVAKMLFGDLLAQARERWIRGMDQRLGAWDFTTTGKAIRW